MGVLAGPQDGAVDGDRTEGDADAGSSRPRGGFRGQDAVFGLEVAANPWRGRYDVGDLTGSEWVAERLPGARIVKAFNTLFAAFIAADPQHEEGHQAVFYAGDDADAKAAVAALLNQFGFAALDLGGLREGGRLMQLDGPLSAPHFLLQDAG
ncbi:hypothetical protein OG609_36885 [Streptomyces sp. NBC_01224]|uniref:hypothetical protein n=1 Tax=Streptomyces sp. NBC_01224 TaxID=2903783 RepID=UPI002E133149|nr:hypothetical protein OG609_36885 [Streptomyces sp. NBC_01224]